LICKLRVDAGEIEAQFEIDFARYFSRELDRLRAMQDDGLLEADEAVIRVNTRGRLLVRNICAVFDAYLETRDDNRGYSRAI
jgi:oxygen-independent coproporphyrinogen-3 oxidase